MTDKNLLKDKKILIVDDEPDVLETLVDLLTMCNVVKASNFAEAKDHLETQYFDMAILDIMGVDGYQLLEIAQKREVIAVMLTAHALSVEDTVKSYKEGAASYIPKEEMANIAVFLNDILEARDKGQHFWWRWFDRFGSYYERKFGPDWQDKDKEFWEKFIGYI
ncbi:response regulator [Thermodesulfobacteriota bacterium]